MKQWLWGAGLILLCGAAGCHSTETISEQNAAANPTAKPKAQNLLEARQGFQTKLLRQVRGSEPAPIPPANSGLKLVQYPSPAGKIAAHLSTIPQDGKKHPAIIWIIGGFGNDLGETAWEPADPSNDQSAQVFRKAGVVTMYPSFRGGNTNGGVEEDFYGEVDDVLAAADFLARQPGIDPKRIYLGGHSTGGTLALLVTETATTKFRATFAFGPVTDIKRYGADRFVFDTSQAREFALRAPARWLEAIAVPTFAFEGEEGNASSLRALKSSTKNPMFHAYLMNGMNHFNILAPVESIIAKKIIEDTGETCNIAFTQN